MDLPRSWPTRWREKGTSSSQTALAPGDYVALDTVADNPSKWPHVNFTVTANAAPATLAKPQATVATEEFRFTGPSKLHDGQLIRFENDGYLYHMIIALPVKNKAGAKALDADLLAGNQRKANKLIAGAPLQFMGSVGSGGMNRQVSTSSPATTCSRAS